MYLQYQFLQTASDMKAVNVLKTSVKNHTYHSEEMIPLLSNLLLESPNKLIPGALSLD